MRSFMLMFVGLAVASELSPITRVAELLEGLSKKVYNDGKAEQELYDQFKCWCTKVIDAKSTSLDANANKIKELAAYIDDLSSGRVELTSERSTLEAEIKGLEKSISEEETMREKEHADFVAAKDEMDKAVRALEGAVQTLKDGTKDNSLAGITKELKQVMNVGQGFLAKNDLAELTKVLDVPKADWKKLNQDATHKQKYTSRSDGIQGILGDMLTTFTDNRDEAVAAEDKAAADFEALMGNKRDQLKSAKEAMQNKDGEGGARGEALATSETSKGDLEAQNERDTKFLADTKDACKTKAEQWSERKRLRAEEIASINEAIGVLRSDDARDTFSKSMSSQGFIQLSQKKEKDNRFNRAMAVVRGLSGKDVRLAALAVTFAGDGDKETEINEADPFTEVISAIDNMITDLQDEEKTDMEQKDQCEKDRMENSQKAKMSSKKVDTSTETMDRLTAEIAASNKTIQEINAQIEDLEIEKRDAGDQRVKEAAEHAIAAADDEKAQGLVDTAIGALAKFYEKNGLNLVQIRRVSEEPFVAAGEAPTPPPSTFEGDYGGSKGENQGIVAILEMIKADIGKDAAKAQKEEEESIERHEKFVEDIDTSIKTLGESRADEETTLANAEGDHIDEATTKNSHIEELNATLAYLADIAPGCDFIAVNFDTRLHNRQAEIDGLKKAKAILNGAGGGTKA